MKKIELEFNTSEYQKELTRLMDLGKRMAVVQEYILEITKEQVSKFDVEAINEWIKQHYNFINVQAVMDLQNQRVKYDFVKAFLLNNEPQLLKQFNMDEKGVFSPSKELLKDVKERFTTYVNEDILDDYKALKQANDMLSKCNQKMLQMMIVKNQHEVFLDFNKFPQLQQYFRSQFR